MNHLNRQLIQKCYIDTDTLNFDDPGLAAALAPLVKGEFKAASVFLFEDQEGIILNTEPNVDHETRIGSRVFVLAWPFDSGYWAVYNDMDFTNKEPAIPIPSVEQVPTTFFVKLAEAPHKDGTTHEVWVKRDDVQMLVHEACCQKEADDVASELNTALERAAYRFDD